MIIEFKIFESKFSRLDPFDDEEWNDDEYFKSTLNNIKIIKEDIDQSVKYKIGDIVQLKGQVPGIPMKNFDYEIGEIIDIICLYDVTYYDIICKDLNIVVRNSNILRSINEEDMEEIKRKKEENRLKYMSIDPFGEENWD